MTKQRSHAGLRLRCLSASCATGILDVGSLSLKGSKAASSVLGSALTKPDAFECENDTTSFACNIGVLGDLL